jgi:hypothetical protein
MKRKEKDDNIVPNKPVKIAKSPPVIHTGGDFADVVTEGNIFIDKTLFIKEIIEDASKVILITMPRRWGKSLNLDMLKRFLSIEEENQEQKELNKTLFAGGEIQVQQGFTPTIKQIQQSKLAIEKPEALDIQGQYPVIFIDFKDCKGNSVLDVESKLKDKIFETVRNFSYLHNSEKVFKETTLGKEYLMLLNRAKDNIFPEAIKELTKLLYTYHNKKVWILIDEYDAAANKAYLEFNDVDAEKVSELFRSIFEPALKGNKSLEKGVMTGVQYIVKSGMLSGLNDLSKYNVTSTKYSKYYGINQEEMDLLLEHFRVDKSKGARIKDWYDGYQENINTSEEPKFIDKYNIWSVVNYLNNQSEGFKSYWEKSGSIEFMNHLFKKQEFKEKIELLVNGGSIYINPLKDDFTIEDFKVLKEMTNTGSNTEINAFGLDLIFSYFFITGYLTVVKESPTEYQLPNKELIKEFGNKIQEYYKTIFNIDPKKFLNLSNMLSRVFDTETIQEIQSIFKNEFAPAFDDLIKGVTLCTKADVNNSSGLFANEDLMHSLLNNIALQIINSRFASERYTTKPDGRKGRADIVIEKNTTGVVIEMKYNGDSKDALEQSKQYKQLINNCTTKVFIGCNISAEQEVLLSGEIVNDSDYIAWESDL